MAIPERDPQRNPRIPEPPPPPHLSKDQRAIWPHKIPEAPPAPGSARDIAAKEAADSDAREKILQKERAEEAERITIIKETFGEDALEQMAGASKTMHEANTRNVLALTEQKNISAQERGVQVVKYLEETRQFSEWLGMTKHGSAERTLDAQANFTRAVNATFGGERKAYYEGSAAPIEGPDDDTRKGIGEHTKTTGREFYRVMQEDLVAIGKQPGSQAEKKKKADQYLATMSKFTGFFNTMVPPHIRGDAERSLRFTLERFNQGRKG